MIAYVVVCLVAFGSSLLTFFSGFGLGTLLMPAFAIFFDVPVAIALTAFVHLLNNFFKLALVHKHVQWGTALKFGLPAAACSAVGAKLLVWLGSFAPLASYQLFGGTFAVKPVNLAIAVMLLVFTLAEALPRFKKIAFDPRWLPVGGAATGFCGGLSGHQGALRSAFLIKLGLEKEAYIATGVVIACLVDIPRLAVYAPTLLAVRTQIDYGLLVAATASAFVGALVGNHYLKKVTWTAIHRVVCACLILMALALAAGLL